MSLLRTFIEDGSLLISKWVIIFVLVFGLIGALCGALYVITFEQTSDGKYASHDGCIDWDYKCESECANHSEGESPCPDCCISYGKIRQPLGERIGEHMKLWGLLGGCSVGFLVGAIYGEERRKKRDEVIQKL